MYKSKELREETKLWGDTIPLQICSFGKRAKRKYRISSFTGMMKNSVSTLQEGTGVMKISVSTIKATKEFH